MNARWLRSSRSAASLPVILLLLGGCGRAEPARQSSQPESSQPQPPADTRLAGDQPEAPVDPGLRGRLAPLVDLEGQRWTLREPGLRGVVMIFFLQDCPVANGYAPRIERLHREFSEQGIRLLVVQADPRATAEALRRHAREHAWTVPVVADPRHELVRAAGATAAPQAIVWDAQGRQVYSGRIDDQFVEWGKKRLEPTRHDLRDVLETMAAGRELTAATTPVVGCYLRDLQPIP